MLKDASNRYDFEITDTGQERGSVARVVARMRGMRVETDADGREHLINPDVVEALTPEGRPVLKDGWMDRDSLAATMRNDESVLWRGVSWEEMRGIIDSGVIQSNGSYEIGDEETPGMTSFATRPDIAVSYASGYAPWQLAATRDRPSYIIRVRRPDGVIERDGLDEAYTLTPTPVSEVLEVWEVAPSSAMTPKAYLSLDDYDDTVDFGSGSFSTGDVAYRKVGIPFTEFDASQPRHPKGTPLGGQWVRLGGLVDKLTDLKRKIPSRRIEVRRKGDVIDKEVVIVDRDPNVARDAASEAMRARPLPKKGTQLVARVEAVKLEADGKVVEIDGNAYTRWREINMRGNLVMPGEDLILKFPLTPDQLHGEDGGWSLIELDDWTGKAKFKRVEGPSAWQGVVEVVQTENETDGWSDEETSAALTHVREAGSAIAAEVFAAPSAPKPERPAMFDPRLADVVLPPRLVAQEVIDDEAISLMREISIVRILGSTREDAYPDAFDALRFAGVDTVDAGFVIGDGDARRLIDLADKRNAVNVTLGYGDLPENELTRRILEENPRLAQVARDYLENERRRFELYRQDMNEWQNPEGTSRLQRVLDRVRQVREIGGEKPPVDSDLRHIGGRVQVERVAENLPDDWVRALKPLRVQQVSGARASWSHGPRVITINDDTTDANLPIALHELLHAIEDDVPEIGALVQSFLGERTKDDAGPVPLAGLRPGRGHAPHEVSLPDDFYDPYIGRVYEADDAGRIGHEVMTVVLQDMLADGFDLAKSYEKDPDTFHFALGVLALV